LHILTISHSFEARTQFSQACIGIGAGQGRIPQQLSPAAIDQNLANQ